jgi:aminoglycoside phosphotransferase (APT) family kinase protein
MRLVKQHTSVPVPIIIFEYNPERNKIGMSFVRGSTLKSVWDELNEGEKERICREIWTMIAQWRQIPLPHHLAHLHQCLADGSAATTDALLEDLVDPPRSLDSDEALRLRIYQRYRKYHGERYANTLLDMLPRSNGSVFTHGDVAPRNIMIKRGHITGILDWELAGWYPNYWEYANIMKPSADEDWQSWMDRTAPQKWDLSGIIAARRVLF